MRQAASPAIGSEEEMLFRDTNTAEYRNRSTGLTVRSYRRKDRAPSFFGSHQANVTGSDVSGQAQSL